MSFKEASHHFGPDNSERDILARTFHYRDISARACFGISDLPAHGNFVFMDVMTQGLFDRILGTMDIWAHDILAPERFDTWIF